MKTAPPILYIYSIRALMLLVAGTVVNGIALGLLIANQLVETPNPMLSRVALMCILVVLILALLSNIYRMRDAAGKEIV